MRSLALSLLRSPLLQFVVLGAMAFALYVRFKPADIETIHVTSQTIDALVQQRESITQQPVSPEGRKELIEGHIEEEVLLREAYKSGFDKTDYRVRRRILTLMRSALTETVPEPSLAQLRAFYEEHRDRYEKPASITFEQVYFAFASSKLPADPNRFLAELGSSRDLASFGDSSQIGSRFSRASFERIAMTFGKPFTESVFDLPRNVWKGPIESFVGIHYVFVSEDHESEMPPFENIEPFLRTDYLMSKSRESQASKIENMRKNYQIVTDE